MFPGARVGAILSTGAGFGGEEENPKRAPCLARTGSKRSRSRCNQHRVPLFPLRAAALLAGGHHPSSSALPGMLPCTPESQFINPDLIIKITERENNKSGLLAAPALKLPSPHRVSVPKASSAGGALFVWGLTSPLG